MRAIAPLLLCLLSALVEVHSQTSPYLTFMGNNIPNHSYVDLNTVGIGNTNEVQCHTDLDTCCGGAQGVDRGDWYFPNGNKLQFSGNVYEGRGPQLVVLRYTGSGGTSGIYRCDIETNAVNNNDGRETVYVGLYTSGGGITIPGGMTLNVDSDLNGDSPQFTLTCISTGGPATTVTWTRDSETVSGGMTVFNNAVTAQYTHTLTVTGRLGGQYQCNVTNRKLSTATAQFTVQVASAPTGLTAVQEGPTSIRVSWTPPTPLGDTTGYRIYYSGGSNRSEDVSGGSTHNHLLTGLQNGDGYTISIRAISNHFYSNVVEYPNNTMIKLVPGQPAISLSSTTPTTISLTWTTAGSVVDHYEVKWERNTSRECPGANEGSATFTGGSTSYTITGLQEDISYTITVRASNAAGSAVSVPAIAMTGEAAPSAPPTSVGTSDVTSSIITVQWGPVDCIHRNGDITGYSVRYGAVQSGNTQTVLISGGATAETIISGLDLVTNYSIEVAAVNSAGIGPYNDPIYSNTLFGTPLVTVDFRAATTISLSWPSAGSVVDNYEVMWERDTSTECPGVDEDSATITGGSTSYTISRLEEDSNYTITVRVTSAAGSAVSVPVTGMTGEAAPSAPPTAIRTTGKTSSSITVQWGPVDCLQRNGDITGYSVQYGVQRRGSSQTMSISGGNITETTISGLTPSTTYSIEVATVNSAGIGAYSSSISSFISEASFMLQLTGYIHCIDWITEGTALKLADITRAVEKEISASCQCQITTGTIDGEYFACSEASPNSVMYQARLSGTSEKDSTSFNSVIEDWVSTGPTILVRGVLVGVGEECSTAISDLSEGVCSSSGNQIGSCAGAIGGLAAAVAVVLVVAIAVIVVIVLLMRKSSGPLLGVTEDFPMTAVHSNQNKDVTTFKSNEAYNIVEQRPVVGGKGRGRGRGGGGGEEEIEEYEEIGTTCYPITHHQQPKITEGGGGGSGSGGGGGGGEGKGDKEVTSAPPQLPNIVEGGGGGAEEGLYEELPGGE